MCDAAWCIRLQKLTKEIKRENVINKALPLTEFLQAHQEACLVDNWPSTIASGYGILLYWIWQLETEYQILANNYVTIFK